MGSEDVRRITEELEGLLMTNNEVTEQAAQETAAAEVESVSRQTDGTEAAESESPQADRTEAAESESLQADRTEAAENESLRTDMVEAVESESPQADMVDDVVSDSPQAEAAADVENAADAGQSGSKHVVHTPRRGRPVVHADFHGASISALIDGSSHVASRWGLIAAFAVPVLIMLIIFIQRGIFPFGEESFLRTDMYHQYAPFFSEFQYKLKNGQSLLYSWDVGMGVNFSALYAYYLASPLNWLLLLVPSGLVIEFMSYMIVFKIGLAGLAMAWYLRRHCGTADFGVAFFGIFYALSGYMAAYSWNIMWLDCIVLFPLVMLGLERLMRDGKCLLYIVTLGLSILSNYYISIMTCVFLVIWFFALLVLERKHVWEDIAVRGVQFAFSSLLAGGLAAVVLLPEVAALQMTASGNFSFPKTFTQYFPIFDMIARHIGNVETEIGLDHWPNIYCGVAVLMFALLYLAQKKIPAREKAVYCLAMLFFYASFSMNILNFIWHGFHYPNSLPCRQAYIYILLLLLMCYRAYMYLDETPRRQLLFAFWGAVAFVLLAQKLVTQEHFHFIVYYVAILFLALYLGAIFLSRRGRRGRRKALILAITVVSLEAAVNMAVTSVTTTSRTSYTADNAAVEKLVSTLQPNDSFFRVEKVTRKTKNDGAWMHFPSVSLFSSTANADLSTLFRKLGMESSTNAYSINGSTPLIDMLFAVKYGIYSEEPENNGLRSFLAQEGDTLLYQNSYVLPLGFMVPADFEERWDINISNPADVQNSLTDCLGAAHVLSLVMDAQVSGQTLTFTPEESGEYYAYVENKEIEKVSVSTEKGSKTFDNVDRGYLLELGYCEAGETVTLTAQDTKESMWADIYRFSEKGLASVYDKLSAESWKLLSWTDTTLSGTVACVQDGLMLTTIPWDEGWTITVDGAETDAVKMLDAFVGVSLTEGNHTVEMYYCPKGLKAGALISGISLLILAVIVVTGCLRRQKEFLAEQKENAETGKFYTNL
ncbi:MAG: YfhO family protein [Clostridiales bacterium]|nr:YfhO family protein [Clostridiales bacterium]